MGELVVNFRARLGFLITLLFVFLLLIHTQAYNIADGNNQIAGAGANIDTHTTAPEPSASFSWGLERINAPRAWQTTRGSEEVIVAILDSGIDYQHLDLADSIWTNTDEIPNNGIDDDANGYVDDINGWDFQDSDNDSLSGSLIHYHGTFVAGLIAAQVSETAIAGVAPNVQLMDLRILDRRNRFKRRDWPSITSAVHYAIDNGAQVINLSIFSNEEPPVEFHNALRRAIAQNVVVVGATGNSAPEVQYPGRYDEVLAIGAIDAENNIATYSVAGPQVAFVAPGSSVDSLMPNNTYGNSSGTSWSAAYVSGAIALLLSVHPDISRREIMDSLIMSSEDLGSAGPDEDFGYGLIDAEKLLDLD